MLHLYFIASPQILEETKKLYLLLESFVCFNVNQIAAEATAIFTVFSN